jgi:hypothetical protein
VVLWQLSSVKGSIERRYVVGGPAPLGFTTTTPLVGKPPGRVRVEVRFERDGRATLDAHDFDAAALAPSPVELGAAAPPCGHREGPGATAWLFAAGAAFVVAGYARMLLRYARGR